MFYEESYESLVCTEWCTVDTKRSLLLSVAVYIFQVESFWYGEIELISRECELASDRRSDLDIDLRSIECAFVLSFKEWNS